MCVRVRVCARARPACEVDAADEDLAAGGSKLSKRGRVSESGARPACEVDAADEDLAAALARLALGVDPVRHLHTTPQKI